MPATTPERITAINMTMVEMIMALTSGHPGAVSVLIAWVDSSRNPAIEILGLDVKRLYDNRIWDLYCLCGEDIERFKYHVQVELPNQESGLLSVNGPYHPGHDNTDFWDKRRFGAPNSFWALEFPPTETNYEYPIR